MALASRDPVRPLVAAVALASVARVLLGGAAFGGRLARGLGPPGAWASRLAIVVTAATFVVAVAWNTHVVGGSDSSCYVLQADAFAHGRASLAPVLTSLPAGVAEAALAPTGFISSPRPPYAAVPICAAGLALLMAPAAFVHRDLVFLVVPLFAALAVWFTFALGRLLGGARVGVCGAVLLATSPIFLYQSVQPMSDVPATALWLGALVLLARTPSRPALAGVLASVAVLTRPNLLVAVVPLILLCLPKRGQSPFPAKRGRPVDFGDREKTSQFDASGAEPQKRGQSPFPGATSKRRRLLAWTNGDCHRFLAGMVPAAGVMLALNVARYGGPLASGYGSTDTLFSLAHVAPNLARYPRWLFETETPLIALALLAPWILWRSGLGRLAVAASTAVLLIAATYLAYTVFDDWWYTRFVLPALPVILTFSALVCARACARLPYPRAGLTTLTAVLALCGIAHARDRQVFALQALEARFAIAGAYGARALPADAVILAGQQSGSLRYYGGRATLAWDAIAPDGLDGVIGAVPAPFIALEDAEVEPFRRRFATERAGQLDWAPVAEIHAAVRVRIFDARGGVKPGKSEQGRTEHIWR